MSTLVELYIKLVLRVGILIGEDDVVIEVETVTPFFSQGIRRFSLHRSTIRQLVLVKAFIPEWAFIHIVTALDVFALDLLGILMENLDQLLLLHFVVDPSFGGYHIIAVHPAFGA